MYLVKCFALLCLALATHALERPDFIKPCHVDDQECIKNSAKIAFPHVVKGIEKYGVPSFDPLERKVVNGDNGDLKLKFLNMVVKGLSKCDLTKIERPERLKIDLDLICPIVATGNYKLNGSLLLIPVEGDDTFEIKMDKLKISTSSKLKIVNKGGKDYYKIGSFDFKYEALEKVHFHFYNLFHGDEARAEPINKILDDSWKEIISEIGKPVLTEIVTSVVKGFGKVFEHMPCDEFELQ